MYFSFYIYHKWFSNMALSKSLIFTLQETTRVFLVWAYHKNSDADNVLMYHTNRNYTEEAVQVVFPPLEMTSTPPAPMTRDRPTAGSSAVQVVVGGFALSVLATLMFWSSSGLPSKKKRKQNTAVLHAPARTRTANSLLFATSQRSNISLIQRHTVLISPPDCLIPNHCSDWFIICLLCISCSTL